MPIFVMLLDLLLLFGRCFDVLQVAQAAKDPAVMWHFLLRGRLLLHSVGLVSCTSSTCVLQMYFLSFSFAASFSCLSIGTGTSESWACQCGAGHG